MAEASSRRDQTTGETGGAGSYEATVSGIRLRWEPQRGTCTFQALPVAMMWIDSTLTGLMLGAQSMVGTERFCLALQAGGRDSVEADWQIISQFPDFRQGFAAIATIAAVAGWGQWELLSLDEEARECRFRVRNSWESRYQKTLGVCWGSAMLAGKLAGYCTRLFGANCWADQTAFACKGDPWDEFHVHPSTRSLEQEIENLLATDEATRADMAVAMKRLRDDVAERRRAEDSLRQMSLAVEQSPAAVVVADLQGNITYVNPNFTEITGYRPEEVIGKNPRMFRSSQTPPEVYTEMWQTITSGRTWRGEWLNKRKDGELYREQAAISPIVDAAGHITHYVAVKLDVTERWRFQEALRSREEKLRLMFETSPVGMAMCEMDGRLVEVNQAYLNIIGYTREEALRLSYWDITPRQYDQDEARQLRSMEETGKYGPYEKEYVRKTGERVPVLLNGMVVIDEGRRRIWSLVTDIAEMKRMQEELRRSRDELERRVTERTIELEHRARQLARLTSELTLTEQRERHRLAQVLHEHLQQLLVGAKFGLEVVARHAGQRQSSRVRQVQTLLGEAIRASRELTAELFPPILHEVGLGAGLQWLARWMEDKHRLKVEVRVSPDAEPQREDMRVLLYQSARELLLNVVKHAGVARARMELARQDESRIRLGVSDDGVGFAGEPAPPAGDPLIGGYGLFSIRERLHMLGGGMDIRTSPGQGTHITLVAPCPLEESPAPAQAGTPQILPPAAPARGAKITILLADDHTTMREGLSRLLGAQDDLAVVGQACDGAQAVELARRLRPDVILMDAGMPVMDGVQATRIIHAEQPGIRVIGLSMYDQVDRAADMLQAGADDYLAKSGSPERLLSAIRQREN